MRDEQPRIEATNRWYNRKERRAFCSVQVRKVSLDDLLTWARANGIDSGSVIVNGALKWEDDGTPEEIEQSDRWARVGAERHEQWERETYERLRAKFQDEANREAEAITPGWPGGLHYG